MLKCLQDTESCGDLPVSCTSGQFPVARERRNGEKSIHKLLSLSGQKFGKKCCRRGRGPGKCLELKPHLYTILQHPGLQLSQKPGAGRVRRGVRESTFRLCLHEFHWTTVTSHSSETRIGKSGPRLQRQVKPRGSEAIHKRCMAQPPHGTISSCKGRMRNAPSILT